MATHNRTMRRLDRETAARAANLDPRQPRVMQGQFLHEESLNALLDAIGGSFDDSTVMEMVDPATGKFYIVPGISAPGGTDVPRP